MRILTCLLQYSISSFEIEKLVGYSYLSIMLHFILELLLTIVSNGVSCCHRSKQCVLAVNSERRA